MSGAKQERIAALLERLQAKPPGGYVTIPEDIDVRDVLAAAPEPILPPSEQQFRQRVRDLEASAASADRAIRILADLFRETATEARWREAQILAENARLRRAVRVLARLQSPRVARAVMEVISDE